MGVCRVEHPHARSAARRGPSTESVASGLRSRAGEPSGRGFVRPPGMACAEERLFQGARRGPGALTSPPSTHHASRSISPSRSMRCSQAREDRVERAVEGLSVIVPASAARLPGQGRFDQLPLLVRELESSQARPPRHGHSEHSRTLAQPLMRRTNGPSDSASGDCSRLIRIHLRCPRPAPEGGVGSCFIGMRSDSVRVRCRRTNGYSGIATG